MGCGIGSWSLRFADSRAEAEFVVHRQEQLLRTARVARLVAFAATIASCVAARDTFVYIRCALAVVHLLLLALEQSNWLAVRLGPAGVEAYFAANMAIVALAPLLCTAQSPLLELDAEAEHPRGDFLFGVMAAAVGIWMLPVRWYLTLPSAVATVAAFLLGVLAATPSAGCGLVPPHCAILALLVLSVACCRRIAEIAERRLFSKVAEQKSWPLEMVDTATAATTTTCESESFVPVAAVGSAQLFAEVGRARGEEAALAPLQNLGALGRGEHWLIDPSELRPPGPPVRLLGCGGFGFVIPAHYYGAPVALKAVRSESDGHTTRKRLGAIAHELRMLRRLRHPNLVSLYGACIDPGAAELILVLEHVEGVGFQTVVSRPLEQMGMPPRIDIAKDVLGALTYLHSRSPAVVHGDVKASNVLVEGRPSGKMRAKLLDFGLSSLLSGGTGPCGGTRLWAAPEVLAGVAEPCTSADVYSSGWLVFMAMTGRHPSEVATEESLTRCFAAGEASGLAWDEGPAPLAGACLELCGSCLRFDADLRPSMRQVLQVVASWSADEDEPGTRTEETTSIEEALAAVRRRLAAQGHMQQHRQHFMRL